MPEHLREGILVFIAGALENPVLLCRETDDILSAAFLGLIKTHDSSIALFLVKAGVTKSFCLLHNNHHLGKAGPITNQCQSLVRGMFELFFERINRHNLSLLTWILYYQLCAPTCLRHPIALDTPPQASLPTRCLPIVLVSIQSLEIPSWPICAAPCDVCLIF